MPKNTILLGIIFVSLLTMALFQVKYKVVELENEITTLNREIFQVEESIHLLKAEWAYRTSPTRLSQLAEKHLSLATYTSEQIQVGGDAFMDPDVDMDDHRTSGMGERLLLQASLEESISP